MKGKFSKLVILLIVVLMAVPPLAATSAQDKVKVTFWHMEQPSYRVERFQELIDEFNAANPDIVVSQEPQNWGDVYTKAPAAIAAGNAPEMLFAIPDFTPILKDLGVLPGQGLRGGNGRRAPLLPRRRNTVHL